MVSLKRSEMRVFDDAFRMHDGYVLNFSDRSMAEFFEDEFGIQIYQEKYACNGTSKAKRLRAFIETEGEYTVAKVARALWQSLPHYDGATPEEQTPEEQKIRTAFSELLARSKAAARFSARTRSTASSATRRLRSLSLPSIGI
ncbi:MAG: hypothetical protein ACXW2I_17245 [Burkholderiales bacterium]